MQEVLSAGRTTALLIALAVMASPSSALELGPVEVFSALGEKLDARIPLKARDGEWFHATCLSLTAPGTGLPSIADGVLSVERRRQATHLRVRTPGPVNEPALGFGVRSTCAGESQPLAGVVTVLLDPPRAGARRETPAPSPRAIQVPATRERARAATAPVPSIREAAAPAPSPQQSPPPQPSPPPRIASAGETSSPRFVLRLTSEPIDLARSTQFDDGKRALLRERLRLLDTDDQVAEMLSMRDNLRRLEARVVELQLKLAAMPQSFARPPVPTAAETVAPPRVEPVAPAPPAAAPQQAATTPPPSGGPAPAPPAPAAGTPEVAKAPEESAKPAEARSRFEEIVSAVESPTGRALAAGLAILALLVSLGWWLWMRRRNPPEVVEKPGDGEATVTMEPDDAPEEAQPIEIAAPIRAEMASDAALATRLDDDTAGLRRRYIQERFPEISGGTIVLDDPASVVKGARLFYEDGAMPRAVELLRFAIENHPDRMRPWLALFEVYRLERLAGEYAELAGRFRDRHGATEEWSKVRGFGREIDPGNPLYHEEPMKSLETIGPREARRLAASTPDPIVENWLDAPMDFDNEVLATQLRRALMARDAVEERDLVPNPMPALRSVEMFSVG